MKLTKERVIKIYKTLEYLGTLPNAKSKSYVYKVFKIKKALQNEFDALKEVEPKKRTEFQDEVNKLLIEYCKKDERGVPITKGNTGLYKDLEFDQDKLDECNSKINELAKSLDQSEMIKEENEYIEFLKEEVEVDIDDSIKLTFDDLFDEINEETLKNIDEIIK